MISTLVAAQMLVMMSTAAHQQAAPTPVRPSDPAGRAQFDALCAVGELSMLPMPPSRTVDLQGYRRWRDDTAKIWLPRAISSFVAIGRDEDTAVGIILNGVVQLSKQPDFVTVAYSLKNQCAAVVAAEPTR
jgi:hypothetical protein